MRAPAAALVVLLLAAGCGTPPGFRAPDCPDERPFGHVLKAWPASYHSGHPADFLYVGTSAAVGPTTLDVRVTDGSRPELGPGAGDPVPFEDRRFTPALGTTHFGAFRLSADAVAQGGVASLFLRDPARRAECDDRAGGLISDWAASATPGAGARPGQGVHVWYATFWENGTLLGTNLPDLDAVRGWPRAAAYEPVPLEPLRVHVHGGDAGSRPPGWTDADAGPAAYGTPAELAAGSGYTSAVPGVDAALDGLAPGARLVLRLAPEEAFTRVGGEAHPLHGDALVVLLEVAQVVDPVRA